MSDSNEPFVAVLTSWGRVECVMTCSDEAGNLYEVDLADGTISPMKPATEADADPPERP